MIEGDFCNNIIYFNTFLKQHETKYLIKNSLVFLKFAPSFSKP